MRRRLRAYLACVSVLGAVGGCADAGWGILAGTGASIAAIHRTPMDALYSAITGRDCSVVWLDRGQTYCRPREAPPLPQPYCTRSLGGVDCWDSTHGLGAPPPTGLAEGPSTLTPAQEKNRTARWPQVWLGTD